MARVLVVGAGFAGLSAAARLAKLRHDVVVLESSDVLGGRLRPYVRGTGRWDLTPPDLTLPGSVRDLFRKSGRPLERVLDLVPVEGRRHVFDDRSVLDLPHAPRSAQHDAVAELLGDDPWSPWVDGQADRWDPRPAQHPGPAAGPGRADARRAQGPRRTPGPAADRASRAQGPTAAGGRPRPGAPRRRGPALAAGRGVGLALRRALLRTVAPGGGDGRPRGRPRGAADRTAGRGRAVGARPRGDSVRRRLDRRDRRRTA
ncbi:MAG: NAD(P)-binding protein [Aeromicrobium erythreum]